MAIAIATATTATTATFLAAANTTVVVENHTAVTGDLNRH
jgi:hypothetical protein